MAEEKEYKQQDKADEIISAIWQGMKGRPVLTPDEESLFEKIKIAWTTQVREWK